MRYGDKTVPKLVLPPTQRRKKMNLFNYYGSGELKKKRGICVIALSRGWSEIAKEESSLKYVILVRR